MGINTPSGNEEMAQRFIPPYETRINVGIYAVFPQYFDVVAPADGSEAFLDLGLKVFGPDGKSHDLEWFYRREGNVLSFSSSGDLPIIRDDEFCTYLTSFLGTLSASDQDELLKMMNINH